MAGKKRARLGLQRVVQALLRGEEETLSRSMEIYRMHVYREGTEERGRGRIVFTARLEVGSIWVGSIRVC